MICPRCQGKTAVVDSRSPGDGSASLKHQGTIQRGTRVYGWWSNEFRVRRRRCCGCGGQFGTIEVATNDLVDAFDEIQRDEMIGSPWREEEAEEAAL